MIVRTPIQGSYSPPDEGRPALWSAFLLWNCRNRTQTDIRHDVLYPREYINSGAEIARDFEVPRTTGRWARGIARSRVGEQRESEAHIHSIGEDRHRGSSQLSEGVTAACGLVDRSGVSSECRLHNDKVVGAQSSCVTRTSCV